MKHSNLGANSYDFFLIYHTASDGKVSEGSEYNWIVSGWRSERQNMSWKFIKHNLFTEDNVIWCKVAYIYIYIYTLASPWYLLKLTNTDTLMYGPTFIDVDQR